MKEPRLRGAAIFFAVIAISSLVGQPVCAANPEFQGKPVAEWLDALTSHDDAERDVAVTAIRADPKGAKPVLDEFVRQLSTRNILYRLRLRQALASAGPAAFSSLLDGLLSADAVARRTSFSALRYSSVSTSELAIAFMRMLPKLNPELEQKVIFALRDMGSEATTALIEAARHQGDGSAHVHELAIGLLCDLRPKTPPVVQVLVECLNDPSLALRREVVQSLRSVPESEVASVARAIRKLAINDPEMEVRIAARVSLEYMGKYFASQIATIPSQEFQGLRLLGDLHDREPKTVRRAIYEAGTLGPTAKEMKPALSALLFNSTFATRSLAAAALALVSGNLDSLALITDGIHENESLSSEVIELLVKIGMPAAPVLLDAEQHAKDEAARNSLTDAVKRIAIGKEDREALRNLLKAESPRVQAWAAEKLLEIGDPSPKSIGTLAKRMTDADRRVREKAAVAMMDLGQAAMPALIGVAQDKDPLVRRKAVYVMTVIGQPSDAAVDALVRALDDEDETVRFWACIALGRVKDQQMRLAPLLTARQTDSSEKVRGAARNAFQQLTLSSADR